MPNKNIPNLHQGGLYRYTIPIQGDTGQQGLYKEFGLTELNRIDIYTTYTQKRSRVLKTDLKPEITPNDVYKIQMHKSVIHIMSKRFSRSHLVSAYGLAKFVSHKHQTFSNSSQNNYIAYIVEQIRW